jgi:hypothetical protein
VTNIALERLARAERLRRDVQAYRRVPSSAAERSLAEHADTAALQDNVDWEALYAETPRR